MYIVMNVKIIPAPKLFLYARAAEYDIVSLTPKPVPSFSMLHAEKWEAFQHAKLSLGVRVKV